MSPSAGERKQVRIWPAVRTDPRPAIGAQKKPNRLRKVIQIEFGRCEMPRHRSRAIGRLDELRVRVRSRLSAVSHGRVLFDTHNDLRLAVDALSGGECC